MQRPLRRCLLLSVALAAAGERVGSAGGRLVDSDGLPPPPARTPALASENARAGAGWATPGSEEEDLPDRAAGSEDPDAGSKTDPDAIPNALSAAPAAPEAVDDVGPAGPAGPASGDTPGSGALDAAETEEVNDGEGDEEEKMKETIGDMLDKPGLGPAVMDENDRFFHCAKGTLLRHPLVLPLRSSEKTGCRTTERTLRCINKFSGDCDIFLKDNYEALPGDSTSYRETSNERYNSCLLSFGDGERLMEVRQCLQDYTDDLDIVAPKASNHLFSVWFKYCSKYVCHKDPKMRAEAKESCWTKAQPKIYQAYCNDLCSGAQWDAKYTGQSKALSHLAKEAEGGWQTLAHAREYRAAHGRALAQARQSPQHEDRLPEFEEKEAEARKLLTQWEETYEAFEGKKGRALFEVSARCQHICEGNVAGDVWSSGIRPGNLLKFNASDTSRGWTVAMTRLPPGLGPSSTYELPDPRSCKGQYDDDE